MLADKTISATVRGDIFIGAEGKRLPPILYKTIPEIKLCL